MVFRALWPVVPVTPLGGAGFREPLYSLRQSFVDNVLRDGVEPEPGSVVYCERLGLAGHSGLYVGDGHIVYLNGHRLIESVSASGFMERLGGWNTAISIYVSSLDRGAAGLLLETGRVREQADSRRGYGLLGNNCHCFTATCVSDAPDCSVHFMSELRQETVRHLACNEWRVWMR